MKDLVGNTLQAGDTIVYGTRNRYGSGYSSLRVGVVLNPSVVWGGKAERRVLTHTLTPLYLRYRQQHPAKRFHAARPENLIKVPRETLPEPVRRSLLDLKQRYDRLKKAQKKSKVIRIPVVDADKATIRQDIQRDIETI